ncbi:MAG: multifunctional oxoglutarate decarboxylase/oxoglutarate dehydrogenase thiamine pyrophosphate-binding subunit/dihydrolipoyllysine-residue succinyltransferase subunit [Deltaproteobacteria bacterium]|nr:multifunctional oxoglutarate decarboxylase/oxoglutarate dehydrogenase thiamine pyrophosphate-binding subunit/dihydrolipoyllysine-residue succinyltransferase subunit [Deltaproteobacteria bacterium]
MPSSDFSSERFGVNASYVDSLRAQWLQDPASVAEEWSRFFAEEGEAATGNGHAAHENGNGNGVTTTTTTTPVPALRHAESMLPQAQLQPVVADVRDVRRAPAITPQPGDRVEVLRGIAGKLVENMSWSLELPTAMSTRVMPVKVLEENRRVLNSYLADDALPKASFTHIIAWALVRAAQFVPSMNNGFTFDKETGSPIKLVRDDVNLGLAIDLPARGGGRTLVVPNVKAAQKIDFKGFLAAYNALIERARKGGLGPKDFEATTMTLTNPGGIGTVASAPRLMPGQGCIIATGSIDYPAEYQAMAPETLRALGVGKVMTMTSTYDHRIIQGAESGVFLQRVHELLAGEHGFYEEIFRSVGIPHVPYRLRRDRVVTPSLSAGFADTEKAMRVSQLIHSYRVRGHVLAHVDPLDLKPRSHPELDLESYGLTIWDLDREFLTLGVLEKPIAALRDILDRLRDTYCRKMGVEYMYIPNTDERRWLQERVEHDADHPATALDISEKKQILEMLCRAQGFERFVHKRFLGQKRFSVEGGETAIAMLVEGLDMAAAFGVTDVVIGMAHRGRLNVLTNVMGKPFEAVFAEFDDLDYKTAAGTTQGSGDVKYHLGAKGTHRWKGATFDGEGKQSGPVEERAVRIELACNPSHLEAVNPVVEGLARAKQDLIGDRQRKKVMPVCLHGDAAFAGQGVVYETMQMSGLQGYRTGGTVHLIINNQIGYTTGPERARTAPNASDLARAIMVPVFRVNGDDPETCIKAMRLAIEYRQKFGKDIVLDMVCYRRWGHNEGDDPSFTQPILYKAIEKHESTRDRYASLLVRRKDLTSAEVETIDKAVNERLEEAFGSVKSKGKDAVPQSALGTGMFSVLGDPEPDTRVALETLKKITERITFDPAVIEIHPRVLKQVLERRKEMVFVGKENGGPGVDFGMAEALAFGSLLLEGSPVRMSGQDVGRGTFSHRHAVLYDVNDGRAYIGLNHLQKSRDEGEEEWHPSRFRIYDSLLSEEAVVGFEYGYSVGHPDSLVIWEAQFGDFFNGAQIQIDQFIAAGEAKWNQRSRLVMLLPHGYDGQGPEHSSGRPERFLQLCAEDNMRVCICSTAASYFHLLRRQAKQPKKPLIVFTHKSLLRAEVAASSVNELATGRFETVIDDPRRGGRKIKRLVLLTGKLYWDIDKERAKHEAETSSVAVVRLEQLYPFPAERIKALIDELKPEQVVWAQEEPRNMGGWFFVADRLRDLGVNPIYVGRNEAASPATGSHKRHDKEQAHVISEALGIHVEPGH